MFNDVNDKYILAEYIVTNQETGQSIHKRINLQYIRNPINGAILNAKVFGSWRNRGFWTEKDYVPEEGLGILFSKIQNRFMDAEVIKNDEKFAKAKEDTAKEIETFVSDKEGIKSMHVGVYGANHSDINLGSAPANANTLGAIDVRTIW